MEKRDLLILKKEVSEKEILEKVIKVKNLLNT